MINPTDIEEIDVLNALKHSDTENVYECENDVRDNQQVLFEFEGGITANLNMISTTEKRCVRETLVRGSKGEIICKSEGSI